MTGVLHCDYLKYTQNVDVYTMLLKEVQECVNHKFTNQLTFYRWMTEM